MKTAIDVHVPVVATWVRVRPLQFEVLTFELLQAFVGG